MDGQRNPVSKYDAMRLPTMFVSPEAVALMELSFFSGDWQKAIQAATFRTKCEADVNDRLFWGRVMVALLASPDTEAN